MKKEEQNKASHIEGGVINSENSVTVVCGKDNICVGDNSVIFAYGKGYTDINELQEDHSRIQENPLALLDVLEKNKMRIENIMNGDSKKTETEQCTIAGVVARYNLPSDLEENLARLIELGHKIKNDGLDHEEYEEYDHLSEMIKDSFL